MHPLSLQRAVLAVALTTAVAVAQPLPELGGTWEVVPDRSIWVDESAGARVNLRFLGERFVARLTTGELTITIENDPCPRHYALDGQPHPSQCFAAPNVPPPRQIAEWRGSRLVLTYPDAEPPPGFRGDVTWMLELAPDGTLVVTVPAGRDGAPLSAVYRRVANQPV